MRRLLLAAPTVSLLLVASPISAAPIEFVSLSAEYFFNGPLEPAEATTTFDECDVGAGETAHCTLVRTPADLGLTDPPGSPTVTAKLAHAHGNALLLARAKSQLADSGAGRPSARARVEIAAVFKVDGDPTVTYRVSERDVLDGIMTTVVDLQNESSDATTQLSMQTALGIHGATHVATVDGGELAGLTTIRLPASNSLGCTPPICVRDGPNDPSAMILFDTGFQTLTKVKGQVPFDVTLSLQAVSRARNAPLASANAFDTATVTLIAAAVSVPEAPTPLAAAFAALGALLWGNRSQGRGPDA